MVRPGMITSRLGQNVLRSSLISARCASTAPSSGSSSSASASPSNLPLSWPEYLSLRRQRRIWSRACTVPTTLAGLTLGGGYFGSMETDPTQMIMGLDPMLIYAGATIGCMGLGYLVGPTIGSFLFALTRPAMARGNPSPLEVMDREFFRRISKRRGDPSFQSANNPSPDFYGEKIVSIPTYRRWLRDQAAYNRKATHGLPEGQ